MRTWEINGNLYGEAGLKNIQLFESTIIRVKNFFDEEFGSDLMNTTCFYIDNATENSGPTPISTVALGKLIIIKLGIETNSPASIIAFQFSHELMHVVYRSVWGLDKPLANEFEESVCSAAALITVLQLFPTEFPAYFEYTKLVENNGYRKGINVATSAHYVLKNLLKLVSSTIY